MMSPFGVGGASFRTSTSKMYVDTVPFAVYKKRVFEELGLYNEKLIRNQDDEFNYRCGSKGYKILMHPDLKTEYYVRENFHIDVFSFFAGARKKNHVTHWHTKKIMATF